MRIILALALLSLRVDSAQVREHRRPRAGFVLRITCLSRDAGLTWRIACLSNACIVAGCRQYRQAGRVARRRRDDRAYVAWRACWRGVTLSKRTRNGWRTDGGAPNIEPIVDAGWFEPEMIQFSQRQRGQAVTAALISWKHGLVENDNRSTRTA